MRTLFLWLFCIALTINLSAEEIDARTFENLFFKQFHCQGEQDIQHCFSRICDVLPQNLIVNRIRKNFCPKDTAELLMRVKKLFKRKRSNETLTSAGLVDFFYQYSCADESPKDDIIDWIDEKIMHFNKANWVQRQLFKVADITPENIKKLRIAVREVCGFPVETQGIIANVG